MGTAFDAIKIDTKREVPQDKLLTTVVLSVILDCKQIFSRIDALNEIISSKEMTADEVSKICTTMMTFEECTLY